MLDDSERFAFIAWRIHAFASSGNAYDACQTDLAIETGHTLVILLRVWSLWREHGQSQSLPQAACFIRSSAKTTTR